VVAVESVFQINVGLPNEVIGTHEVMIEYSYGQLWLSGERDAQLQDPGQEGEWLRALPCPQRGSGVSLNITRLSG
jgi:hypothetical protein